MNGGSRPGSVTVAFNHSDIELVLVVRKMHRSM